MRETARGTMACLCVLAVLGAACLCGCAPTVPDCGASMASDSSVPEASSAPAHSEPEDDSSAVAEILTRQDADGLAQLRIEDGRPSIRLDIQRWEALYGDEFREVGQTFGELETADFSDPSLFAPIDRTEDVPIRDACIGTVPYFSDWSIYSFPVPVAMLLREDGRVEVVFADPFATRYTSEGMVLAFLEDVESLYVDVSSGDGRGDPSIYAACADGLRYDLKYLFSHTFSEIYGVEWSGAPAYASAEAQTTVWLRLFEDGAARLAILGEEGLVAEYAGTHAFVLAEEQDYHPPTLVLDLALESSNNPQVEARGDIQGAYFYELGVQDMFLHLWQSFGDALLVDENGTPAAEYWLSGYGEG